MQIANRQHRTATITRQPETDTDRTITLSVSSEEPYARWWGIEILGHADGEVRLERMANNAPLLRDHRATVESQVGRVTRAWLEDGRLMVDVEMDETEDSEKTLGRIQRGELTKVSVGYQIYALEEARGEADGPTTYRVTDWEPSEVSIVAIAADDTVGYGRDTAAVPHKTIDLERASMTDQTPTKAPPVIDMAKVLEDERKRTADIIAYGEMHKEVGGCELAAETLKQGGDLQHLKDALIDATQKAYEQRTAELAARDKLPTQSDGKLDLTVKDRLRFSITRLVRAKCEPHNKRYQDEAAHELEVCRAWQHQLLDRGVKPQRSGTNLPPDVLLDPVALQRGLQRTLYTTAASADELVGTDHRGDLLVPFLWNMSAFLPYVMVADDLVGSLQIPREATEINAAWVAQNAAVTEDDPTFETIDLSPKQLSAMTIYNRTLLNQSSPSVDGIILRQGGMAMAIGEDAAIVSGTGQNNQPEGILAASGTTEIPGGSPWTNGKALDWADTVRFETAVANENALFDDSMYFLNPATIGKLKTTLKATGTSATYIYNDMADMPINGYAVRGSNQIPRNLSRGSGRNTSAAIFGSPMQVLCAHWSGVDLVIDNMSRAEFGDVRMVFYRDLDVGVLQPKAFAVAKNGIITT